MAFLLLTLPTLITAAQDGLAKTPPMGWNTYNHYNCQPNESIVHSNAQALLDLDLAPLGYRYVTTDCGWTVSDRLPNGSVTWNETTFPSGFPALGRWLHERGLLFGVYEDSGVKLCGSPPDQVGSLYHEEEDATTFAEWDIDALKYDNCFSDAETNYPVTNYSPSQSPRPRYANMSTALSDAISHTVLFQICEWGVDFPALWAPSLGHTWRIGNDIIPAWRSIARTLNQAVPQTDFAGPGQWPDLDMLEVGNGVLSRAEEETHFSMWAVLKSPLVIGAALRDEQTAIGGDSLEVLKNKDVISYNQDELGESVRLRRRWTEEGFEVWSGRLSGDRTVAALINWREEERELSLDLADVGLQHAGLVRNIWANSTAENVKSRYSASVEGHGTMLVELRNTTEAGVYPSSLFGQRNGASTTFDSIYGITSSNNYTIKINFSQPSSSSNITISTASGNTSKPLPSSSKTLALTIPLSAGLNTLTIHHDTPIDSIQISPPEGTYYPSTSFGLSGSADLTTCGSGYCKPTGSKITSITPNSTASITIPATVSSNTTKYLEIDYINNDIAFASAFDWGTNSRNLTIQLNGGNPVRLEVPLSGRHSELFGPGLGWWDSATLGVLVDGWKDGDNEVVIGNVNGEKGSQAYGADFVGLRILD
ncbi:hypothetical protein ASPWEDRAFT_43343 [Aspergillus wentii DTO 134E9]|uniref:Alpha-galactosidase n=1 Tax=Aspergillus wentii DTO 134E9 TaxID=1073089 RepID=A0A1L9REG5_ASPWE|nr:uncharacterized protein ASPWEDRAFT_43343 [Aspergillus wentii DTO 134E9]OJJ33267.1 hypothetical protein ASPWEDRAFT_43343 [Aspergillus wentii DTO 134E9]